MQVPGEWILAGAQEHRTPGGRTPGEVTMPPAEGRARVPGEQDALEPMANSLCPHSSIRHSSSWPPPCQGGFWLAASSRMPCMCTASSLGWMSVFPLNGDLLDYSPAHSLSKSPLFPSLSWATAEASLAWVWWKSILVKCQISGESWFLPWNVLLAVSFIEIHLIRWWKVPSVLAVMRVHTMIECWILSCSFPASFEQIVFLKSVNIVNYINLKY